MSGDSVSITIKDIYNGNESFFYEFNIPIPLYKKQIQFTVPVLGLVGQHNIELTIDKNNLIDEIYEDDNTATFNFIVYSSSIRPIEPEKYYNSIIDQLEFLNPVFLADTNVSSIVVAIANNPEFFNSVEEVKSMSLLKTSYNLPVLGSARYWLRAKINLPQASWSDPFSFFNADTFSWYFNRSFNYSDVNYSNIVYDSADGSWKLNKYENLLEIGSAGFDDGGFGSIKLNDTELLPNTYILGNCYCYY